MDFAINCTTHGLLILTPDLKNRPSHLSIDEAWIEFFDQFSLSDQKGKCIKRASLVEKASIFCSCFSKSFIVRQEPLNIGKLILSNLLNESRAMHYATIIQ